MKVKIINNFVAPGNVSLKWQSQLRNMIGRDVPSLRLSIIFNFDASETCKYGISQAIFVIVILKFVPHLTNNIHCHLNFLEGLNDVYNLI